MSLGQRLDKAKEVSDLENEEIIDMLESWVIDLRLSRPDNKNLYRVKKIVNTKKNP
ncbi:MAG: hypothetical protein KatS3mg101_0432 [Patescibacteria group bacterium]|nr:MAG: hypothetical protein KatS3mg101_0432 [Patescibacteria group bacterium]